MKSQPITAPIALLVLISSGSMAQVAHRKKPTPTPHPVSPAPRQAPARPAPSRAGQYQAPHQNRTSPQHAHPRVSVPVSHPRVQAPAVAPQVHMAAGRVQLAPQVGQEKAAPFIAGVAGPVLSPTLYNFRSRQLSIAQYNYNAGIYGIQVVNAPRMIWQNPWWGGHWRYGYVSYAGIPSSFNLGLYVMSPFTTRSVISPWYYYQSVPGYLPYSSVTQTSNYAVDWDQGDIYAFDQNAAPDATPQPLVTQAVDELRNAYVKQDGAALKDLTAQDQDVSVFTEGQYDYSMNPQTFHDVFEDAVEGVQTVSFKVDSVKTFDKYAIVHATHEYSNPDGTEETIYQMIRLCLNANHFVVCDFETSHASYAELKGNS